MKGCCLLYTQCQFTEWNNNENNNTYNDDFK